MKPFEYAGARSLKEAGALLREKPGKARIIAGGTDLIPQMRERIAEPDRLVSLQRIPGLDRIEIDAKGLRAGALVPLADIAAHPGILDAWLGLAEGAGSAATPQIRNAGTLGGNICQRPRCWYFRSEDFRCLKKGGETCFAQEGENKYHAIFGGEDCRIVHPSDTAPALVAFEASAVVHAAAGERTVPLEKFFTLPSVDVSRENVLRDDEILSGVRVPRPPSGTRSAYLKIREKSSFDFALVSCAAALTFDGKACTRARLVLGGVAPVPWRCMGAEAILTGQPLDAPLINRAAEAALTGAAPLSRNRYKIALAKGVIRRLLMNLSRA
jgi:xanthine dehydrogenase YagS FAD-binding subunit